MEVESEILSDLDISPEPAAESTTRPSFANSTIRQNVVVSLSHNPTRTTAAAATAARNTKMPFQGPPEMQQHASIKQPLEPQRPREFAHLEHAPQAPMFSDTDIRDMKNYKPDDPKVFQAVLNTPRLPTGRGRKEPLFGMTVGEGHTTPIDLHEEDDLSTVDDAFGRPMRFSLFENGKLKMDDDEYYSNDDDDDDCEPQAKYMIHSPEEWSVPDDDETSHFSKQFTFEHGGKHYRHVALPPGWTCETQPVYFHPEYGPTLYCPVPLPVKPKSRRSRKHQSMPFLYQSMTSHRMPMPNRKQRQGFHGAIHQSAWIQHTRGLEDEEDSQDSQLASPLSPLQVERPKGLQLPFQRRGGYKADEEDSEDSQLKSPLSPSQVERPKGLQLSYQRRMRQEPTDQSSPNNVEDGIMSHLMKKRVGSFESDDMDISSSPECLFTPSPDSTKSNSNSSNKERNAATDDDGIHDKVAQKQIGRSGTTDYNGKALDSDTLNEQQQAAEENTETHKIAYQRHHQSRAGTTVSTQDHGKRVKDTRASPLKKEGGINPSGSTMDEDDADEEMQNIERGLSSPPHSPPLVNYDSDSQTTKSTAASESRTPPGSPADEVTNSSVKSLRKQPGTPHPKKGSVSRDKHPVSSTPNSPLGATSTASSQRQNSTIKDGDEFKRSNEIPLSENGNKNDDEETGHPTDKDVVTTKFAVSVAACKKRRNSAVTAKTLNEPDGNISPRLRAVNLDKTSFRPGDKTDAEKEEEEGFAPHMCDDDEEDEMNGMVSPNGSSGSNETPVSARPNGTTPQSETSPLSISTTSGVSNRRDSFSSQESSGVLTTPIPKSAVSFRHRLSYKKRKCVSILCKLDSLPNQGLYAKKFHTPARGKWYTTGNATS